MYAALKLGRISQSPIDCGSSPVRGADLAFPHLETQELAKILGKMNDLDGDRDRSYRLAALAAKNCENRRVAAKFKSVDLKTEDLSLKEIDRILASGRLAAVGVPYSPVIKKPTEEALNKFADDREALERSEGGHMMLLVGQRWNPQERRCELLFKNSWGDDTNTSKNMKNGYMAIARDSLEGVITGQITTIAKKPTWKKAPLPEFLR